MTKKIIPLARPWFDQKEVRAAAKVVKSGWLISGPSVRRFEQEFAKKIKTKYAVAVNSGSSALLVVQQALGIGPGDKVIVPNMTFVSTASSSLYLGATPVFADINLKTYCIDVNDIEKRITKRTKAIIPVHYAGQAADMDAIIRIAKKYKLKIIEDAAEAHLAKYKGRMVGGFGDASIFSFTPSKPMTTGEGGIIVTNNKQLAEKCRMIRNFCDRAKFSYAELGFNFRMPEIMGAIGLVQLAKLQKAVAMRRKIALRYTRALAKIDGIITPFVEDWQSMNFQLYTIRLDPRRLNIARDEFIKKLSAGGIQSRLYYPCLHSQELFGKNSKNKISDRGYPNSIIFSKTALSLPIYPSLTMKEQDNIIDSIRKIAVKFRNY